MAKVVKGVVAVIGAVASVLAVIPSPIQPIAAIVAAGAAVASAALNIMFPEKPRSSVMGQQTDFRLDPQAGIPYVVGRTLFGGLGVHRDTWGNDNEYHGIVIAWSGGGPSEAIEAFKVDQGTVNFAGGAAVGGFNGFMWLSTQLGTCPSPALASPVAGFPGWGANQKLSGYTAGIWVTKFDKKGKKYAAGLPKVAAVLKGPLCYDPRLDSTYPGGSGPCRAGDESTYVPSQNPWIQAITWALGRWQNGLKVLGVGMAAASINLASFVDAANVADANNWKAGGVVSSVDDKWEVLKMMAQAGGGECIRLGGRLSAFVNAPRVSIGTIETGDLVGEASIATSQFIRSRINGVVPIIRLESHGWEQVPAAPVRFDDWVAEDGARRTVETEFVLVQQLTQGAQLAGYEVCNAREFGPIDLQLKLKWLGIEPGDLVTLNIPVAGLANQKCLALARALDPTTGNVACSFRTETDAKHDLALGKTTTVPPSPSLTPIDLSVVAAPGALAWSVSPAVITGPDGGSFPILRVRGATDNPNASHVVFEYRPVVAPVGAMPGAPAIGDVATDATGSQFVYEATGWHRVWIMQATQDAGVTEQEFPAVTPLTEYEIAVSYVARGVLGDCRILGPVTTAEMIGSGRLWIQTDPPAREESTAGDIWIDDAGYYWVRREDVHLSIGGDQLLIAGEALTITWTPADSQPIVNQVGDALEVALAASAAAAQLALDAQATADGKINSFYNDDPPIGVGESEGDIWFDTNDGKKQYRYTSGAWVSAQDTAIGAALDAAAAADAKADGKVVTFVQEGAPTAEGVGDLWFKESTGELRRWDGAAWSDPLVDLTSLGQITVVMPEPFVLARDRDGVVKPDQLPASVSPIVKRGETSIKLSDSVSYSVVGSGGLAGKVSVDNTNGSPDKGDIEFDATVVAAGEARLTVTVGGVAYGPFVAVLSTKDDPPPIDNGGAGGSDSTLESISDAVTYAVMSSQDAGDPVLDVAIAGGQTLKAVALFSYTKAGGLAQLRCTAEYSLDGVSWTAFPQGPFTGTDAGKYSYFEGGEYYYEVYVGEMSAVWTKSGLAAGTYKVRLKGLRVGASGTLVPTSGYFSSSRV